MAEPTEGTAAAQRRIDAAVRSAGQTVSLAGLDLETPPRALTTVPLLRELDLSGNRLARLPDWFGSLTTLRVLDLSGNKLADLPSWIGGLTSLESLLLRGNAFVALPDALASLTALTRIDLAENQLVEIPPGLAHLPALEHLDLAGNRHLISPPPAIVAQGSAAVLDHLRGSRPRGPGQPEAAGEARDSAAGRGTARPAAALSSSGLAILTPAATASDAGGPSPAADAASRTGGGDSEAASRSGAANGGSRKGPRPSPIGLPANRVLAVGGAAVLVITAATFITAAGGGSKPHARVVATTPGPDVVFDEATPTDATATAPDGGTPTTSPAAPAPTTPTSGAHRLIPGSQSSAPTVPPGAANTRASAPPTPRGATPQQPTPGPPVQSSSAAAPPPATPATPATPAVPGTVNLAARSQVNAAGYLQNYFPTNVVDENIDSYWEAQPGFPQNLTIDLGSVHGIGRIELYLPNQPNWNSRNETIEILGSGTNPAGTDFTILGSHDYHFDANDPNNRDHVSVSFAPAKTRWITLRFTANSGWPDAQLSEIQVY